MALKKKPKCNATFYISDSIWSPYFVKCDKPKGHTGNHEGTALENKEYPQRPREGRLRWQRKK